MRIESYNINLTSINLGFNRNLNSLTREDTTILSAKTTNNMYSSTSQDTSKTTQTTIEKPTSNLLADEFMLIANIADEAIKRLKGLKNLKEKDAVDMSAFKSNEPIGFEAGGGRFWIKQSENESLKIETTGIIKAKGREININLEFNLARSFTGFAVFEPVTRMDPLVISLDANMPTISDDKFSFDIDADGEIDQISKLGANSAFLALDKNANGKIDNGRELFGTKTGDGFGELSEFDDDKNGWIDENDPVFHKLRIWQNIGEEQRLLGLGEVGIGAIFLGSTNANFSYKNLKDNSLNAELKSSGFFLYESGKAGALSQIDFVKHENLEEKITFPKPDMSLVSQVGEQSKGKDMMSILKQRLAALTQQLQTASPEEKDAIQMEINNINSQMLNYIGMV